MNGQQNEFSSFKLLLKQVYSAHTSKVKELENEVTILKGKLTEKDRELIDRVSECKRCNELEEAFKNCKKALHEQSKLFDNFGQKFSIFNSSGYEKQDSKVAERSFSSVSEIPKISTHSKTEISVCNESVSSVVPLKKNLDLQNINDEFKVSVPSNSNLLKKVMCDDGSFDNSLYTVTFPTNLKTAISNGKFDSGVLVADSLDIGGNPKTQAISLKNTSGEEKKSGKKSVAEEQESSENTKVHQQDITTNCKRLSSETLNEDRIKRSNKGDQMESNFGTSKIKCVKLSDTKVQKDVASGNVSQTSKVLVESKSCTIKLKYEEKDPLKNNQIPINENITTGVSSDKFIGVPKVNPLTEKNSINEVKNRGMPYDTSPSLLPLNANAQPKFIDLEAVSNDNDDFQEQLSSSKPVQNEDSWETCDKRKSQRKNRIMKSIKCSSKFKMTLDAPPLNYKKPTYKQVKLSKSLFQPKNTKTNPNKKSPEKTSLLKADVVPEQDENDSPVILDHFQTSTPRDLLTSPSTFDIDATFIPENFKIQISECATTCVKKNAVEKLHLKNGNLFSNISFPVESKSSEKFDSSKREDIEESPPSANGAESEENMDSFNRLPVPKEPNYKYKNDVVRKKSERKLLDGFDCKECEKYYSDLGLSDKEKKVRMKKCSRHRGKFAPPSTPDHFWELDFPDTEECKARGYMDKTQKIKLKNLCDI